MTLIQTQRIKPFPVILMGSDYWTGLVEWIKEQLLGRKMISEENLDIFHVMDEPEEVIKLLRKLIIV